MSLPSEVGLSSLVVTLEEVDGSFCIRVSEQGAGFDVLAAARKQEHPLARGRFGLLSIRERMLSLGGKFVLTSSAGQGTTATLVLPLEECPVASSSVTSHGSTMGDATGPGNGEQTDRTTDQAGRPAVKHSNNEDTPQVRVLVADDHSMIRQGLCSLLKDYSDIQVVGEAANGEEAVAMTDTLLPDVILMDINMPKLDGVEATRRVKQKHPDVAVIGLSILVAEQVEATMREAGAVAFVNKEAAFEELYETIHTARRSARSSLRL